METIFTLHLGRNDVCPVWDDEETIDRWPVIVATYPHSVCRPHTPFRLLTKLEDIGKLGHAAFQHTRCTGLYIPFGILVVEEDAGELYSDSMKNALDLDILGYECSDVDELDTGVPTPCPLCPLPVVTACGCGYCRQLDSTRDGVRYKDDEIEIDGQVYYYIHLEDFHDDFSYTCLEFLLDEDWEFVNRNLPFSVYMEEILCEKS